ncbi:MAG: DEAD/DEAH box helicase [Anaerolineales bacterium]|nr:DEAD/DEAH box helicase [Anaerolineales bacterium]
MSISRLLEHWKSDPTVSENIVAWRTTPARQPRHAPIPAGVHPRLASALRQMGLVELYSHQAEAWERLQRGENVIVSTGTASGKTLCYNLAVIDNLLRNQEARALYLFPTKALSQDQASTLRLLLGSLNEDSSGQAGMSWGIYDGDTPTNTRKQIRNQASILLSNPDMLHTGILPHHTNWADFFSNLSFVILDEVHIYRGVFGSHVANVLRRLKRIAQHYGARPRFILTSATIGNAVDLAQRLVEEPFNLISEDGSARGAQHFLFYNPPIVNSELGLRSSVIQESIRLGSDLLAYDVQAIIFGRSRRTVELILAFLQQSMAGEPASQTSHEAESLVRGYRSGYLPGQRRSIERGLKTGAVRAVIATNALELGIDIGRMNAAVLAGYPGSIAATLQQAGRAGRNDEESVAVLIASSDPLDQYLARHPDYFFGRSPEKALLNPDNLLILLNHLRCAAFELPFHLKEGFGRVEAQDAQEILDVLTQGNQLHFSKDHYYWMADQYPAQAVSLRSASPQTVQLLLDQAGRQATIGTVDYLSAHWMVHPGAIYLHEATPYQVETLDLEEGIAHLCQSSYDYYTEAQQQTQITLAEKLYERLLQCEGAETPIGYGEIIVHSQVTGYKKMRWEPRELIETCPLDMPATELQTSACWITLGEELVERLRQQNAWKNDPNEYGSQWKALRLQARARDRYRCRICGMPESGREHDVHHISPFRNFSDPQLANRLDNLLTLCPACHRRAENAVRVRSGMGGMAYLIGHLAPLYLMCDARDIGVLSDPQSTLAEGQPVILIYDQVPAGIGLSNQVYEIYPELLSAARETILACACQDGCPSCVGPGGENGKGGKAETLAILDGIMGIKLP